MASKAAPIITDGFEVLVQEVIDAITTSPFETVVAFPLTFISILFLFVLSLKYEGTISWYELFALVKAIRSCGRLGPAIEGTMVSRFNSSFSENLGDAAGSCQSPLTFAYRSTNSSCSADLPVSFKYLIVSSSIGKIAQVDPYSGDILPIVARLAIGSADTPGP